jgi:predicted Zn finger-like uncharacterized protein
MEDERVVIISCPACATRFSLDAALLGPTGRNVRCAKCQHKWKQEPPEQADGAQAAPQPVLEKPSDADVFASVKQAAPDSGKENIPAGAAPTVEIPSAPFRPRSALGTPGSIVIPPRLRPAEPMRRGLFRPAYLVLAFLVGFLGALVIFRAEFTRLVPELGPIYALLGLGVNPGEDELEIGNLVFKRRFENSKTVIAIEADLFNNADIAVRVPTFVAIPLDEGKSPLVPAFPFRLPQEKIEPGETITFRALYQDPPPGTKSLRVTFLE